MSPPTDKDALRYLDPKTLAQLKNLELVARFAVQGFILGLHRSPFHGLSVEYSDHRPYMQGDEMKFIDWKVFARSDELHIKRFHQETNLQCHILLDASASMGYGSDGVRKIDYACFLSAALTCLMLQQNDGVGLTVFDHAVRTRIPPSSKGTQLYPVLVALSRIQTAESTQLADVLHAVAGHISRRSLLIVVSDCIDDPDEVVKGLAHLRHLKHDVLLFHLLDHNELHFRFDAMTEFRDMESDRRLRTFPESVRTTYLEKVRHFVTTYRKLCGQNEIDYCQIDTSTPLDRALMAYLIKRKRLM